MKQKHLRQDNKQLDVSDPKQQQQQHQQHREKKINSENEDLVDAMSYSSDTENTTETESINKYSHRRKSSTTINHAHISIKHLDSTDGGGISNNSSISGDDDDDDDDNGSSGKTGRVRFAMNAIQRHEVESHFDYSDKERSKYWWSDREKDRMMAKHERLVAKYEQQKQRKKPGSTKKTKKIQSYRGLESWTSAGSLKLDYTIEQCISAVMDEQDRQWNENDDDSSNISKCSIKVTEDSARRARLNGLQDAQEALRVRGESWALNASDEMSVGSVASYGTAAFAKKKKRSKLLAKLDDSYKGKNTKKEDVLSSLNSSSTSFKKIKKKKKKDNSSRKKTSSNNDDEESSTRSKTKKKSGDDSSTTSKTKRKNSKSKKSSKGSKNMKYFSLKNSIDDDDDDNIEAAKTKDDNEVKGKKKQAKGEETFEKDHVNIFEIDINNITANTTSPQEEDELKSIGDMVVNAPNDTDLVSPLSTYNNKGGKHDVDESPLLATLRRQQQKLKKQALLTQTPVDKQSSRDYEEEEDDDNVSPLLLTLRRQQREQANESHTSLTSETSDPPGRRPRRLTSRHVEGNDTIPEKRATTIPSTTTTTTTEKISRPSTISNKNRTKSSSSSASADTRSADRRNSFRGLRNGATNFFKTGGKGTTITANKKSNKSTSSTTKSSTK